MSTTIAERILQVRGRTKQAAFAALLGVNPNTLRGYENGHVEPNFRFLTRICAEFSVNPTWLLMGVGTEKSDGGQTCLKPQAGFNACPHCLDSYKKLVQAKEQQIAAQEREIALLKENNGLKEALNAATLNENVSLSLSAHESCSRAKTP